jgi:tRNA A-37 threonylcarbamoyl transferase component Bud32
MRGKWYCRVLGQELGPMTSHQLVAMARNNNLLPDDLVRRNNSRWVLARTVKGLFDASTLRRTSAAPRPAPVPVEAVTASGGPIDEEVFDDAPSEGTCEEDESPTKVIRALAHGSVLGNYVILAKLGEGGMGTVLKAQHRKMERIVALKVLHGDATRSPAAVRRFKMEVRTAAKLQHPNIVGAYDADEANGAHFLVMEFVDGVVLSQLLGRGPVPIRDAVNYTLQTAHGLAYAHSEGIVHRDIKPGNLLLDKRGVVKILDMGLARMDETAMAIAEATADESLTNPGQVLGTLDYMSPEQAEDAHRVDHRTDIYSLGCTFFRLLTGRPPYRGKTTVNKIVAHRDQPIPSLAEARAGVPSDLDAVFRRMVAKRPADRYPSMNEVIIDLEMFLSKGCVRGDTIRAAKALAPSGPEVLHLGRAKPLGDQQPVVYTPSAPLGEDDVFQLAIEPEPDEEHTAATLYYRCVMGEELGPLTLAQLKKLRQKKQLTPDDLLRRDQQTRWFPAEDVPELF